MGKRTEEERARRRQTTGDVLGVLGGALTGAAGALDDNEPGDPETAPPSSSGADKVLGADPTTWGVIALLAVGAYAVTRRGGRR